ncbi:hypothetical protein H5P28_14835 [Ruficoccus amylovorans]|uniref:Uncharacterized protein n=1 Tax=Ruficoccus amylovorans TaxID=1804625 RepID=A0A842HH90_9BACT|nr:hypothetical protein [Ruficoccus amylovorans]MBC2595540.1 hypothetical protein [Ruficoccus amylovorans]
MIARVLTLLPYLVLPALVLIPAIIGAHLLLSNGDILVERYQRLVYNLTQEQPEEEGDHQAIIRYSRLIGIFALVFSLCMAALSYYYFFGRTA